MLRLISITILIVILLSGCSSVNSKFLRASEQQKQAVLTRYRIDQHFVYIDVVSHGCTFMNSFKLFLVSKEDNSIRVIRTKPDNCQVKPYKISLNYSYRHLGIDANRPVNMLNQVFGNILAGID